MRIASPFTSGRWDRPIPRRQADPLRGLAAWGRPRPRRRRRTDDIFGAMTRLIGVPLVRATSESLKGFGEIVLDPKTHKVQIVPWPVRGRRKLDPGTGDEGGTTEGVFACQ